MFLYRNKAFRNSPKVCLLFAVFLLSFFVTSVYALEKGTLAPEFALKNLDGNIVRLGDLRGKFVLINFWATWCVPCKMEMPSLERLYKRIKSEKFELLAVSNDMFAEKVVRPYIDANRFNFPVLIDSQLRASNLYGIVTLPTTYLINPEGFVIGVREGADDWDKSETLRFFDDLLEGYRLPSKTDGGSPIVYNSQTP